MTSKINKWFFKLIVICALLTALPGILIAAGSAAPLLLVGIALFLCWKYLPGFRPFSWIGAMIATIVKIPFAIVGFLFGWLPGLNGKSNAKFMGIFDRFVLLNSHHNGFLIDGHKKRLSEKDSFESVMTVGGMGRGKSSIFVIPNLLTLDNCSTVISDTSGEIYQKTSGYLASRGFSIRVLNLIDPNQSETYNPLAGLRSHIDVDRTAEILIRSSGVSNSNDPIWSIGAQKLLKIFIQCLLNLGDPQFLNLANVKYLIANFDAHTAQPGQLSVTDQFVLNATRTDTATFNEYQAFTGGNVKTMLSFLNTADIALSAVGNPEIANLTATSSFDFAELRRQKTALFILVRQQDMTYYQALLSLFYTDLTNYLLSDLNNIDRPVYMLLDEFGHLQLPNFSVFATTARKYRVGFWLFLQSLSQLESQYGQHQARTILDGLQTELYLPGLNLDTARQVEQRLGMTKARSKGIQSPLLSAQEIIQLKNNRALLLHSNQHPVLVKTKPYFKQASMNRKSNMASAPMPVRGAQPIRFVSL